MRVRVEKVIVSFREHLSHSDDLVTTYEEIRAGFIALALERNRRATPFVEQARSLKVVASKAKNPQSLLNVPEIEPALLAAAGISDKASSHLQPEDKTEAIKGLIDNFLEPAGPAFVEELIFRFLLTRGDTLGGSMRNVGGALAQRKLTRAILSKLALAGISYKWLDSESNTWLEKADDDTDIELRLRALYWLNSNGDRTMIYNLTVPIVKNNVDMCILRCRFDELTNVAFKKPELYIALGELKGGIDPAGADEHWKTARTSLSRIRRAFSEKRLTPHTFFVGAAVAKKMAKEIWDQLDKGTLGNASNLTNADQVTSLCQWLCSL